MSPSPAPAPQPAAAAAGPSRTPTRRALCASQSAPAKARPQSLLTSPAAARRSQASMETFKLARALKEGLTQLKARVDPHARPLVTPRRVQRTASAAAKVLCPLSAARYLPHYGSFSSDSSDGPGGLPADDLLHARPMALHASLSCPQRRRQNHAPAAAAAASRRTPPDTLPRTDRCEVAEAAETMILFMRSKPLAQSRHALADPAAPAADGESVYTSDTESTGRPPQRPAAKRSLTDTDPDGCAQRPRRRLA
ncbi:hypothetical protein IWQ56_001301 [Coemansia nantahalensis]|nr:hypothetical protein IWQ56_001301 [Coemansia nantahalensis]